MQRLAHRRDAREEAGLFAQHLLALGTKTDIHDLSNAPGPRRHHHHPIRQEYRLGDRVRHEHDRRFRLSADTHEFCLHPFSRHLIEGAEWFVHEEQFRALGERTSDRDALLHPARELIRMMRREIAEPDELDQLGDPTLAAGDAVQLQG